MKEDGGKVLSKANTESSPHKPKILFSLKDFLDRSDEPSRSTEAESLAEDVDGHMRRFSSESDEINDLSGGDSDVISDSESSDLELANEINVDKSIHSLESNSRPQNGGNFHFTHASELELESEIALMDKLKQRLDDNTLRSPKTEQNENIAGSNLDPINIDDNDNDNDIVQEVNSAKLNLKGISISVVGVNNDSKHVDLATLFASRQQTSHAVPSKLNLSHSNNVQKIDPVNSENVVDVEEINRPSAMFASADDKPGDKNVPTITLDENITVEDISSDESFEPESDLSKFDNCAHGDLSDYICASCAYSRWRCERGIVKNLQIQSEDRVKSQGLTIEKINPVLTGEPRSFEANMSVFSNAFITEKEVDLAEL